MGLSDSQTGTKTIKTNSSEIEKAFDMKMLNTSMRALSGDIAARQRGAQKWNISPFGFNYLRPYDIYAIAQYADILQIIFNARGRESFRNGFNFKPLTVISNEDEKETINLYLKRANANGQSLIEVFKQFLKDLDTFDDAYILVSKNYYINENNEIMGGRVEEILRLNPMNVELVIDADQRLGFTNDNSNHNKSTKAYFDLKDRQLTFDEFNKKTGLPNLRAHYKVKTSEGDVYYNSSEVLHKSLHNPSITYGYSPLYALYPKLFILITQDDFIRKYYGENKPPKGLLIFNTDNTAGLSAIMDKIREESKANPHEIFPIPFHTKDGRKPAEFIDMSRTLQEMQFTDNRNEFRNQIGAMYGVSPIFQNDVSTSGGLNNEGLQITVTNRAVEEIQTLFNDYVIPFIFEENIGITDWKLTLNPSEEEDEAFKKDLETKELQNIKLRLEMGQIVTQDENGKFNIAPGELKLESNTNSNFLPFMTDSKFSESNGVSKYSYPPELKSLDNLSTKITPEEREKFCNDLKQNPNFYVEKQSSLPKKEVKQFETALEKELNQILKQLDLSKRPSEKEYKDLVDKVVKNLEKQLKAKSANRVKAIYKDAVQQVNAELNLKRKFSITEKDKNIIEALKRQPVYQEAFADLSNNLSKNLKEIITKAYDDPKNFSINKIVEKMKEQTDIANNRLKTIARTETSKISMAARKISYEKSGDFNTMKFKVIGPDDKRTGEDSKEIKKLVGEGKSWDEIVEIIRQVSRKRSKNWTVEKDFPQPRPNWRHVIVKVV